jgi:prevent-host-death family protein
VGIVQRATAFDSIIEPLTISHPELYSSIRRTGVFMPIATNPKNDSIVVSALSARANFGKLLTRVDEEQRSIVIEKRGTPRAVLLSIRDYVKLAAPEPEVLRIVGEEAKRNGTSRLTSRQIDQIIRATRAARRNKKKSA